MRVVPVMLIAILILIITYSGCSDQQKLTQLETELLSALIVNFQNIAQSSVNPDQSGNVLYLLKHIAHIKATVTSSLAYAMVLDNEGKIVVHNQLGDSFFIGQKLADQTTKKVLANKDSQKPYFQFYISENSESLIDVSLPVLPEEDGSLPEGYVRIGIYKSK